MVEIDSVPAVGEEINPFCIPLCLCMGCFLLISGNLKAG